MVKHGGQIPGFEKGSVKFVLKIVFGKGQFVGEKIVLKKNTLFREVFAFLPYIFCFFSNFLAFSLFPNFFGSPDTISNFSPGPRGVGPFLDPPGEPQFFT